MSSVAKRDEPEKLSSTLEEPISFDPSLLLDDDDTDKRKTVSHPVYSDYSHIVGQVSGVASTKFAVSLRGDDDSEMIKRILPLTKIIPGQPKSKKKATPDINLCMRPECVKQREKLAKLKRANDAYKIKLVEYSQKIESCKAKGMEKQNEILQLRAENEITLKKINQKRLLHETLSKEVALDSEENAKLKSKMSSLTIVVNNLRKQLENLEFDLEITMQQTKSVKIDFPSDQQQEYNSKKMNALNGHEVYKFRRNSSFHHEERNRVKELDSVVISGTGTDEDDSDSY